MSNKNKNKSGMVYSTEPGYVSDSQYNSNETTGLPAEKQTMRIFLDRKPGGKLVTRVSGYQGNAIEFSVLASALKKLCGVGGTVKDESILIQGDHRDKVIVYLIENGFKQSKKAGG
jgi:translation initiation factor 1